MKTTPRRLRLGALTLGSLSLLGTLLPFPSASAAAAGPNDRCFGKIVTIYRSSENYVSGGVTYKLFRGTPGADVIIGTDAHDWILGGGGSDIICSRAGNDRVEYDTRNTGGLDVDAGYGDDKVYPAAGTGEDPTNGGVSLHGGPGNDHLWGTATAGDGLFQGPSTGSWQMVAGSGSGRSDGYDFCRMEPGAGAGAHVFECDTTSIDPAGTWKTAYNNNTTASTQQTTTPTQAPVQTAS